MSRALTAGAATLASALALAACGGSSAGLIPASNANRIGNDLTALGTALANHNCRATQTALDKVSYEIASLPSSVDRRLADNLQRGESDITAEAPAQCKPAASGGNHPTHTTTPTKKTTTGPTGTTGQTGTTTGGATSPPTTGPSGTTTSTSPTGATGPTSSSGGSYGPGGGSQAPTGSSGTTGASGSSGGTGD